MPLGSRITQDGLLEGRRRQLYGLILERPGVTFMELVRASLGHIGVTSYHLFLLERHQLVRSCRTHRCRRYYAFVGDPEADRRDAILREPHMRATYERVQAEPGIAQRELVERFPEVTRQSVAYRLGRLVRAGIIWEDRQARSTRYRPAATAIEAAIHEVSTMPASNSPSFLL